jgi:transposase InsO family protein
VGLIRSLGQRGDGELVLDIQERAGRGLRKLRATKEQAFDYIEVFHKQQRRHSTLGYLPPADFERRRLAAVAPAA